MPRREIQQALQDELWIAYYRSIDLILVNLIWFVFSAPLITAPPALGGLFYAANRMAHGGSGDWRHFWEGFRRYFWLSWRWSLMNAAALTIFVVSLWFYGQIEAPWALGLQWFVGGLAAAWIALQLFTFPLLLEQADQRLVVALRNSGVLFLRWPGIALSAIAQILVVALLSTLLILPAWIVISASFCAYRANRAVVLAIQKLKNQAPPG